MMKKGIILTLTICALAHGTHAQLLNRLRDKANKVLSHTPVAAQRSAENSGNAGVHAAGIANVQFAKSKGGGAVTTSFMPGDNIYAVLKFTQSLGSALSKDALNEDGSILMPVGLTYVIDNVQYGEHLMARLTKEDLAKRELILDILPGEDASTQYTLGSLKTHIAKTLLRVSASGARDQHFGTQTYDFTFGPQDEFKGTFSMKVQNSVQLATLERRVDKIQGLVASAVAKQTTLPPEFNKPGHFSDPQLSLANLKRMIQYPGMTIVKITIDAAGVSDYYVNRNALGEPLFKMTNKPVWVAYRENGKCFYTKKYFIRQYLGGGKYGPLELGNSTADVVEVNCANIQ